MSPPPPSFLLATPIILAAGLLEIPKRFTASAQTVLLAGIGGLIAGLLAFGYFLAQYLRLIP